MKKLIAVTALYGLGFVQSCICPTDGSSTTYVRIESARGLFYSFDPNGIFPYLDSYNRHELGISVMSDSTTKRIEVAQRVPTIFHSAYACQNPHRIEYENSIDSVSIFTVYGFDSNHPAGSKVNDILNPMDIMGETTNTVKIEELAFIDQHFKFSVAPTSDSMQFVITGRIGGRGKFTTQTDLIVLRE